MEHSMTSYFYFKIFLSGEGLRALYLGQEQDMTSHLHRTSNGHK